MTFLKFLIRQGLGLTTSANLLRQSSVEFRHQTVCVLVIFMALISAVVFCARFKDSSVSVRRVNVVFSTAGFSLIR